MKRLLITLSILAILSSSISQFVMAKGGSGGSDNTPTPAPTTTSEPAVQNEVPEERSSEPTPTPVADPEPVNESEPVIEEESQAETPPVVDAQSEPTPSLIAEPEATPTTTEAVKTTPSPVTTQKATTITTKAVASDHCGLKNSVKERISCRFSADQDTLKYEQENAYFPEGCRTGSNDWQEDCKERYKKINACWYDGLQKDQEYNASGVIDCLKNHLQLPKKLVPTAQYCEGKGADCAENYKQAVYHLIVGRFYDAEERAELLFSAGKITQEQTITFITFISESKINFYSAKTKAERVAIIKEVQANWDSLTKNIQK